MPFCRQKVTGFEFNRCYVVRSGDCGHSVITSATRKLAFSPILFHNSFQVLGILLDPVRIRITHPRIRFGYPRFHRRVDPGVPETNCLPSPFDPNAGTRQEIGPFSGRSEACKTARKNRAFEEREARRAEERCPRFNDPPPFRGIAVSSLAPRLWCRMPLPTLSPSPSRSRPRPPSTSWPSPNGSRPGQGRHRTADRRQPVSRVASALAAGKQAIEAGPTHYCPSLGLPAFRETIAADGEAGVRHPGDGRERRRRPRGEGVRAVLLRGVPRAGRRGAASSAAVPDLRAEHRPPRRRAGLRDRSRRRTPSAPTWPTSRSSSRRATAEGDLPQLAAQPDRRRRHERRPQGHRRPHPRQEHRRVQRRAVLPHGLAGQAPHASSPNPA